MDAGYRRLGRAVRRALRNLLQSLDKDAVAKYMVLEDAVNARDMYSTDAIAQWAYQLGLRDGATPLRPVRVRRTAMRKFTRLRKGPPR